MDGDLMTTGPRYGDGSEACAGDLIARAALDGRERRVLTVRPASAATVRGYVTVRGVESGRETRIAFPTLKRYRLIERAWPRPDQGRGLGS